MCTSVTSAVYAKEKAPVRFDAFDGGRVGARAQGMGFAFTSIADNADAPFWNPAGLNKLPSNLFAVSLDVVRQSRLSTAEIIQGEPLRGRTLTYLAFAGQNGALGFRPMSDIDELIVLDSADPDNNFEKRQIKINSFFLSAGSTYNENMTVGLNIHYLNGRLSIVREKTGEENLAEIDDGNGYTIDWSLLYSPDEFISIGVTGQNLPGNIFWGDYAKTILPAILRAGISMRLPNMLLISYDYEKRFYRDGLVRPNFDHIGIELPLGPKLRIRGGIYGEDFNEIGKTHYTAGLGYVQQGYFVDIAMDKYNQLKNEQYEKIFEYLVSFNIPFGSLVPSNKFR
ncbi:MAG: hypothetical protein ABII23_08745 [bacterium]